MTFRGNTFQDSIEYGFDPHDFSDHFVVEDNVAFGNGKHGFIFSRGCVGNVLRNNRSHDNVGHGFMIDDGRSQATEFAEARIDPSNDNQVVNNVATNNGNNGVEVEGGTGNVVANNQLVGNYIGIRTKNDAHPLVRDNTITDSVRYGIDIQDPTNQVPVANNTISGSWGGISLGAPTSAVLTDNTVDDVNAPMCLPKDIRAFIGRAHELGADKALVFLRAIDDVNLRQRQRVVELARTLCGGSFIGKRVALLGVTFKPNSDDVRDSPALNVGGQMVLQGAAVVFTDPEGLDNARRYATDGMTR